MIIVWGKRFYGKVGARDGSYVRSLFGHLMFMPLFPLGSYLVVKAPSGKDAVFKLPLHGLSLLAGYARLWSLGAAVMALGMLTDPTLSIAGAGVGMLAVAVGAYSFFGLGRASAADAAQWRAYAEFAGAPVDVALVAAAAGGGDENARRWLADIKHKAQAAFAENAVNPQASYRDNARLDDWRQAADSAALLTPTCQKAALTLARIATADKSTDHAAAVAAHAKIWSAITSQPELAAKAA